MENSSVTDLPSTDGSSIKTKILSDEWVAELLSVNSENSQSENECDVGSLMEANKDICKPTDLEENTQTNGQLDVNHCGQNDASIVDVNSENECAVGSLMEASKDICKPTDLDESIQTNGQLDVNHCEQNDASIVSKSSEDLKKCNGMPDFLIDKKSYREESDSSIDDESDSSSSTEENAESSDSSLDFMNKKNEEKKQKYSVKTRGELGLEDLPPIEELSITVLEKESELIGKVHSIVDQLVVVRAIKGLAPIDLDSVLFLSHNRPLGHVFDVFGPIGEPFYSVRFNREEDIKAKLIEIGTDVYYAPGRSDVTKFVFLDQLRKQKGSDASWYHNNEPPEEFLDFSNDEEERSAKKMRQKKKREREEDDDDDDEEEEEDDGDGGGRSSSPAISIVKEFEKPDTPRFRAPVPQSPFRKQTFNVRNNQPTIPAAPVHFYTPRAQVNNFIRPRVSSSFNSPIPPPTPFSPYNQRPEHQFGQMSNPRLFSPAPVPSPRPEHQFGHMNNPRLFSPAPVQSPRFQGFVQVCPNPTIIPVSFSRSPPSFAQTPTGFSRTPNGFSQAPNGFSQTPNGFSQAPPVLSQTPAGFSRTPPVLSQPHTGFSRTPPVLSRTPPVFTRTPPVFTRTPPVFVQTPPVFAQTPQVMNSQPTVFYSSPPNFMRPQLLSPQLQPNVFVPSSPMTPNVPPPNVPLSIQVPPNYLNSPPPLTPTMPVYTSPQPVFYNPPYHFQNNRV